MEGFVTLTAYVHTEQGEAFSSNKTKRAVLYAFGFVRISQKINVIFVCSFRY